MGDFYSEDDDRVVIMMHGFTGDRHEWGTFDMAAQALFDEKYSVLNFDFGGSGESDDDSLAVWKQIDDANCAITYAQRRGFKKIGLLGLSLGGMIAAKVCDDRIKTAVFWAPVTHPIENPRKKYNTEQLQEIDEKGYITYCRDKGFRREIIIDKQMLEDRVNVDPKELLENIRCPVLIVHGDEDDRVPLEGSKNAMQYLPLESRLVIVNGANHLIGDKFGNFIANTVDWFNKYL